MATKRYAATARWLHWIVALVVAVQLVLGYAANWSSPSLSNRLLEQHVEIGLLFLGLMLLRLLWRLANSPPEYPESLSRGQRRLAKSVHAALYALLLAMPLTGYVLWAWTAPEVDFLNLVKVPILFRGGEDEFWRSAAGYAHEYGGYAISALVLLHVSAALFHSFIARDLLISDRMGFGATRRD